jgi:hypothetical protein
VTAKIEIIALNSMRAESENVSVIRNLKKSTIII